MHFHNELRTSSRTELVGHPVIYGELSIEAAEAAQRHAHVNQSLSNLLGERRFGCKPGRQLVIGDHGLVKPTELGEQVAKALLNKGVRLSRLRRPGPAVDAYDQVVARFATDPALAEQVARARHYKDLELSELRQDEAAPSDVGVAEPVAARLKD